MGISAFTSEGRLGVDPGEVVGDAARVLAEIRRGRGGAGEPAEVEASVDAVASRHDDLTCVVRLLRGDWGVYGVGAASLPKESAEDRTRPGKYMLLHPLWFAVDSAAGVPVRLEALVPARDLEWATPRLEALLGIDLADYVLQASSVPRPLVASGDGVGHGTLGPRVTWWEDKHGSLVAPDVQDGHQEEGFLTAAHAVGPKGTAVWVDDGSSFHPGSVVKASDPAPYGQPGAGRAVQGDVDAALVSVPNQPAAGLGAAGEAVADDAVKKTGAATGHTDGVATAYLVWCGGPAGVWSDCYGIVLDAQQQQLYTCFADHGDSGAGVLAGDSVIGMVVGSAMRVSGCPQTVTYVQDILTIEQTLRCVAVP